MEKVSLRKVKQLTSGHILPKQQRQILNLGGLTLEPVVFTTRKEGWKEEGREEEREGRKGRRER